MAVLSEFSYDGLAGEYVEVRLAAGEDPSPYAIEVYTKSGNVAALASTIPISNGSFSSDGTYDYYVIYTSLADGPRDAIALTENGVALDFVAWGADGTVEISGGSLDGTSQPSIGTPLASGSTDSLSKDPDGNWVTGPPTPGSNTVFCFASDVMLAGATGLIRAGQVTPGTWLLTSDHGLQMVRWVGRRHVSAAAMARNPAQRPVLIRAGALGRGIPRRDLRVSRQHRIVVRSAIVLRMTGAAEVLIPAIRLVGLPGIEIDSGGAPVDYIHLLFDQHEVLLAESALAESLLATDRTRGTLGPHLAQAGAQMEQARPILDGSRAKRLIWRHEKNGVPLQSGTSAAAGKELAQELC